MARNNLPLVDPTKATRKLNQASFGFLKDSLKREVKGLRRALKSHARRSFEIRELDRKTLKATREVDLANQRTVDSRFDADLQRLISTIEQTAKTLAASVNETASTLAASQGAGNDRLGARLERVEHAQLLGAGQAGVRDPQLVALEAEVGALRAAQAAGAGRGAGARDIWVYAIGAVGCLGTLVSIGTVVVGVVVFILRR